jgi:hypothetical protein
VTIQLSFRRFDEAFVECCICQFLRDFWTEGALYSIKVSIEMSVVCGGIRVFGVFNLMHTNERAAFEGQILLEMSIVYGGIGDFNKAITHYAGGRVVPRSRFATKIQRETAHRDPTQSRLESRPRVISHPTIASDCHPGSSR